MKTSATVLFAFVSNLLISQHFIARYEFNGNVNDYKGGLNGIVYGALLAKDRNDKSESAYHFDGIDDYIEIDHGLLNIDDEGSFSIETYVKIESKSSAGAVFSFYGCPSGNVTVANDLFLLWYDRYNFTVAHRTSTTPNGAQEKLIIPIPMNFFDNYHHMIVLRDGKNSMLKLYLDGVLVAQRSISTASHLGTVSTFIGKHNPCIMYPGVKPDYMPFKGAIDYFRIRKGRINDKQAMQLFNKANRVESNSEQYDQGTELIDENEEEQLSEKEYDKHANEIKMYPIPCYDKLSISASEKLKFKSITVVNQFGQMVFSSSYSNCVNTSNLKPGIYYITLSSDKKNHSYRIFVNK